MIPSPSNIQRIGLSKRILYRDNGVIALNKPPGLVCQKTLNSNKRGSIKPGFDQLLIDLQQHLSLKGLPYPVHRLDKGTTGALLLACTAPHARTNCGKTYLALVRGSSQLFASNVGEFQSGSKPSVTKWELLASSLRVHLAQSLNAPILGDNLHSTLPTACGISNVPVIPKNRLFLHAADLAFFRYRSSGPNKRIRVIVRAPLPEDFVKLCADMCIPIGIEYVDGGVCINGEGMNLGGF
ncbi:pseudouridine synthase [Infundibulicybe gibba]|nr:pseudouridine synthase [Infundibulicybe gibba]